MDAPREGPAADAAVPRDGMKADAARPREDLTADVAAPCAGLTADAPEAEAEAAVVAIQMYRSRPCLYSCVRRAQQKQGNRAFKRM